MAHQEELEKTKYRNWVRGALAYKYLKQGIEGFADDVVLQEHNRILQNIIPPGQTCNQCKDVRHLRPKHASAVAGTCPRGQNNCSCQDTKKKPCPNQVCDAIMGDILDSHSSQPPAPYWKNADIQKWCSDPWEVAKCFINAPGYADKTSASGIDASGLLHIFINNTKTHSHLSCAISTIGTDVFSKVRRRRNQIFHSPKMEMDQNDLYDCIANIITILEDAKELKQRPEAKTAVEKLKELKQNSFVITTNNEVEVCREAMVSTTNRTEELKEMIENAKNGIDQKVTETVDDKTQKALEEALGQLKKQNDSQLQTMGLALELMNDRVKHVETDNAAFSQQLTDIQKMLEELDTARNKHKKQLTYVEQKQALQISLVKLYENEGYFKTWISPLKTQQNNIAVKEIYVTPNMVIEKKDDELSSTRQSSPGNETPSHVESKFKKVDGYPDIFQTDEARHQKINIIGDVGTGKSTLSKMMIFNWCKAIRGESNKTESTDQKCNECHSEINNTVVLSDDDGKKKGKGEQDNPNDSDKASDTSTSLEDEHISAVNMREMNKFDFLFTITLQGMSGFKKVIEMLKALYNPTKDVKTDELMTEIFNQESERCLVIADGLDEWSPPKDAASSQHVSYGILVRDGVNNATLVTLSRPSAKGILNMKLTEYDQKIKLLGLHTASVNDFVNKYMALNEKKEKTDKQDFMKKIRQTNLEHLEKTPLILQQLVWLYCTHGDIGNSVATVYSSIVNIIFGWFENKGEEDITQPSEHTDEEYEQMQLPELLRRFPRCELNKRILFPLGKLAFKACDEDGISTFGRFGCGLSKYDTDTLIKSGVLVEHNCHDPTFQKSSLSFIHISYLEFFAAVYISSNYRERYPTPKKKPKLQSRMVLNKLFKKIKSVEDILRLSNILRMVCGLSPFLLEEIFKLISKQMMNDESMIRYRNNISQSNWYTGLGEAEFLQNLISNCLLESGRGDKPAIRLCDVIFTWKPDHQFLTNIVTESVVSVNISLSVFSQLTTAAMVENIKLVSKFYRSQFIKIHGIRSCEACKHLSSFLSQAVSLKQLSLNNICCDRNECEGHTIYLSNHDQLNSLEIHDSSLCLLEYVVNTKSLDSVSISQLMNHTPHRICETLSSWLTQAVSLKKLTLRVCCDRNNCEGHAIDLSKYDELQSINIDGSFFISQAIVNTKSLDNVSISNRNYHKTPHGICEQLSSSLSQAVSIVVLQLRHINCDRDDCNGHAIDLSKHDYLRSINLHACSLTLGSLANAKSLKTVSISGWSDRRTSHAMCEHLSSSLSQAVSIERLELRDITCDRDDCEGHAIDLSKHDHLQSIGLNGYSFTLGSMANAKRLERVSISGSFNRRTSHTVCEHLLLGSFKRDDCDQDKCEGYAIDLSKHDNSRLDNLSISNRNYHKTSHGMCEHLSSSLSQAVSIVELQLRHINCDRDDCNGHAIDLSKHDYLRSINLHACSLTLGSLANAKSLKTVSISGCSDRRTSHAMCEHLSSSLSHAVSIKQIEFRNITCDRDDCEGHVIDFSKYDQTQIIYLNACSLTLGSLENSESLERVSISGSSDRRTSHAMCEHLSSSLSQAVSMKWLYLRNITCDRDDCEGHAIDLSKHNQLQSINLDECSFTLGSMANAESLKTVSISGRSDHRTSHAMCEHLSSSLSQAVSIEKLKLRNITCYRDDCEGHAIDLSKHDKLRSINLVMCSLTLGSIANAKSLETVSISGWSDRRTSHAMCEQLSSSLSQAVSIKQLQLINLTCDKDNCDGHIIDLSEHEQLHSIYLEQCSFTLGSAINAKSQLSVSIRESSNRRTPHAVCGQLSSSVSQAVSIKQLQLTNITCDNDNCDGHIIDLSKHEQLHIIQLEQCAFTLGSGINAKSLQDVYISESSNRKTPHAVCGQLSSSISQAVSIKKLQLINITCDKDNCDGHIIDLSEHEQLHSIFLEQCSFTLGSGINAKSLQDVSIRESSNRRTPHAVCGQLSSSLSQAVSIKQLQLTNITCDNDNCDGHIIDLSKHEQLHIIQLEQCAFTLGSGINAKSLQDVYISESSNRKTPHAVCGQLSSSISQAVSIKKLQLINITCDKDNCDGHIIDLSEHEQLHSIFLEDCSFTLGSGINAKSLQDVSISESSNRKTPHAVCGQLSSSLSQAVSIKQLQLINLTCDKDNCDGHIIDLSEHEQLHSIYLEQCSFTLGSAINAKSQLSVSIRESSNRRTPHAVCGQLSSSVSQAVSIKQLQLTNITCDNDNIDLNKCSLTLGCMANAKSLKTVSISGRSDHRTSHAMCEHLSSSLSQAVSIERLELSYITCDRDDCEGHVIDLSKQDHIQSIELIECSFTLGCMANAKSLETVDISGWSDHRTSHAMCEHLSSSLSQAVSIEELELRNITCDRDDCEGHAIDLSKHDHIQNIDLNKCSLTLGCMANAKSLETVSISGWSDHRTSHAMCEHLSSSLSQAVSITFLYLRNITCDRDDCEDHAIDLSKHNQLQSIDLNKCSLTLGCMANAKSLKTVSISGRSDHRTSHAMCEHLSSSLSQAVSIEELELSYITCDRDDCEGHAIDLSKHDHIQSINLNECSLTLGCMTNAESLETVSISGWSDRRTSHAMCEHLSSSLSQAVSIEELELSYITCDRDDCEGHAIDLSKHDHIQSINLNECSLTLGCMTNAESLETVSISGWSDRRTSHAMCEHLSSSLSQAVSIKRLKLRNITCDRDDCEGHTIDLSKHDQLGEFK